MSILSSHLASLTYSALQELDVHLVQALVDLNRGGVM